MTGEFAIGELPTFARKNPRAAGMVRPITYWAPETVGVVEKDYQRGADHLREAISFSLRHDSSLFLACVLTEMFGRVGPTEAGFVEGLLRIVEQGVIPPLLTYDELMDITGTADEPEFRKLEGEARSVIEFSKGWGGPEALYLFTMACLAGREGPHIAGAMTMIARTALNGKRN